MDSGDPAEVLETLVWLSGLHPSTEDLEWFDQEPIEHSKLFEAVRGSALVNEKLKKLRESPNAWIREAAELVLSKEELPVFAESSDDRQAQSNDGFSLDEVLMICVVIAGVGLAGFLALRRFRRCRVA